MLTWVITFLVVALIAAVFRLWRTCFWIGFNCKSYILYLYRAASNKSYNWWIERVLNTNPPIEKIGGFLFYALAIP